MNTIDQIQSGEFSALDAAGLVFLRGKAPAVRESLGDGFIAISKSDLSRADGVEGIYEFVTASGNRYIGQSNNIARRLNEHGERVAENATILFKEVKAIKGLTGRESREIAEQLHIEKVIGRRVERDITNIGPNHLENLVNPVGKSRLHLIAKYGHLFL